MYMYTFISIKSLHYLNQSFKVMRCCHSIKKKRKKQGSDIRIPVMSNFSTASNNAMPKNVLIVQRCSSKILTNEKAWTTKTDTKLKCLYCKNRNKDDDVREE